EVTAGNDLLGTLALPTTPRTSSSSQRAAARSTSWRGGSSRSSSGAGRGEQGNPADLNLLDDWTLPYNTPRPQEQGTHGGAANGGAAGGLTNLLAEARSDWNFQRVLMQELRKLIQQMEVLESGNRADKRGSEETSAKNKKRGLHDPPAAHQHRHRREDHLRDIEQGTVNAEQSFQGARLRGAYSGPLPRAGTTSDHQDKQAADSNINREGHLLHRDDDQKSSGYLSSTTTTEVDHNSTTNSTSTSVEAKKLGEALGFSGAKLFFIDRFTWKQILQSERFIFETSTSRGVEFSESV
ncbi:unnamed protein product, partial [Amoebophrya sp. A120]